MTSGIRSRLSVLVVDDALLVRTQLRALVSEEAGLCLAAEAETGALAVEYFFRDRPDIVLLDVCLPDSNGFELMQCFKQAAPACAVILLSDAPDPCVEEVSRLLGGTEVCHKADGLSRLRDILRRLLRERVPVHASL
jgi:DNA-binding NarL/FixJ family response regulator